jgi:hypothetical protein
VPDPDEAWQGRTVTDPDQDEFVALRRRAYGRDADIHLDPASLARLEELENARAGTVEDGSTPSVDAERPAPDEAVTVEPTPEDPAPTPWWREAVLHVGPGARRFGRWLRRRRRSTVLIALGTAMIAATLVTASTVIQRVQTDPLQVGAVQIARLTVDGAFTSPFPDSAVPGGSDVETHGFQMFHGLRAMTGPPLGFSPLGSDANSECLNIYVEATLQVQNNGFSGSIYSSCSAGDFPAILQLPLDHIELPDELGAAYPDARGIQFVYDRENDEVVVFADR